MDGNIISRDSVHVTVEEGISAGVNGVEINPDTLNINIGESRILKAIVSPGSALDKSVIWYVDDSSVVRISAENQTIPLPLKA